MPRRIDRRKRVQKSSEYADRWLMRKQRKHEKMLLKSISKLQRNILGELNILATRDGKLQTAAINLGAAQRVHRTILQHLFVDYEQELLPLVNEFDEAIGVVARSLEITGVIEDAAQFSGISAETVQVLKDGTWREFKQLGQTQTNKIVQSVYDNVVAGESFSTLVESVEQALTGSNAVGVTGRPLVQYARLYARDALMDFHNEVTIASAEELGMDHFLYVGDIISTTRKFCRIRAGKIYTINQIQSWTHRWAGKSGPALTKRGGYNCRHHWQPVRPEWFDGENKIDIADWDLEHRQGG